VHSPLLAQALQRWAAAAAVVGLHWQQQGLVWVACQSCPREVGSDLLHLHLLLQLQQ
jgi:hypothetical protein